MLERVFYSPKYYACYVPIYKNASVTFTEFFRENNWEEIDVSNIGKRKVKIYFSHIQNPRIRLIKGISQLVYSKNAHGDLQGPKGFFILRTYHDPHVIPISVYTANVPGKIHYLVMDGKQSCNDVTNQFFQDMDMDLKIDDVRKNQSSRKKISIQNSVRKAYGLDKNKKGSKLFQEIIESYKDDFILYQEAIQNNEINIQRTWYEKLFKTYSDGLVALGKHLQVPQPF